MSSDRNQQLDQAAAATPGRPVHVRRRCSGGSSALLKANMAPLIGRRDALCDRAAALAEHYSSGHASAAGRLEHTTVLLSLLDRAEADTCAVISMLSSPDTTRRENTCLNFLRLLRLHVTALHAYAEMDEMLFGGAAPDLQLSDSLKERRKSVLAAEQALSGQLVDLFRAFRSRLERYRKYAGNSFSDVNVGRYGSAYRAFCDAQDFK